MADVTPLDAGDGSQAVTASAVRGGNYGPSPTPQIHTNVAAPLDVRGGPSQFSFLAAQLQSSLETMRWPLMSAERVAGMEHARQMLSQGKGDAAAGTVNQELSEKDGAYQQGVMSTLGQKHGYAVLTWVQQQMQDPNSGWDKLTPTQVAQQVDAQAQKQMGGMETNGYFATAAAPIVQHAIQEASGWRIKAIHDNDVGQMHANTSSSLQTALAGGPAFDYNKTFATYKNTFGGNGQLARASLDNDILQYARGNLDPRVLSNIQPAPGQTSLPPKTMAEITQAGAYIRAQLAPYTKQMDNGNQVKALQQVQSGASPADVTKWYLSQPGANPAFSSHILSFGHSLSTAGETSSAGASGSIEAEVYAHKITTVSDGVAALRASGATGKAFTDGVQAIATAVSKVQSIDSANPFFKSTLAELNETYRPVAMAGGALIHPGASAQHAGVLADFNTEYQSKLKNESPQDAAFDAMQSVKKKWGDPMGATGGHDFKPPRSYEEQMHLLRENPAAARAAGMHSSDIQDLYEAGLLSPQQTAAAMHSYLGK
jgi:hypothetical protein